MGFPNLEIQLMIFWIYVLSSSKMKSPWTYIYLAVNHPPMLKSEEEKVLLLSASIFSLKDAISVFFCL